MATYIYFALAITFGFVIYVTSMKVLGLTTVNSLCIQVERVCVSNSLLLGVLGTYTGFFIGTKDGLTPESAVAAISTAVPTSIAGLITFLLCSLILTIREKKSYE
jgi:EamA domain-containing membrane protein RarD